MIRIKTVSGETVLTPTMFPDGTSQIWKLPEELLYHREYNITWNFESEREIVDLYSFEALLSQPTELRHISLHIPYLPYARQDKRVSNDSTFNLEVFATLINGLNFQEVTAVDVHNPKRTAELIKNFKNVGVVGAHEKAVYEFAPEFVVFPDMGAMDRYGKELSHINTITFDKIRDRTTGEILGMEIRLPPNKTLEPGSRLLIVDDICDGGATFIGVAQYLKSLKDNLTVGLFITHGIFSKGRQHLYDNGIDWIRTTDSLYKNTAGFKV